jgi:hypothetical protein
MILVNFKPKFIRSGYRDGNPSFIGRFDRITALGSTEHVGSSMGALTGDTARKRSINTLTNVWKLFHHYLRPNGLCYVTVMTCNEDVKWSIKDRFQAYVLDQHYGGYYPRWSDIKDRIVPATGFTMTDSQDQTASYHWSSMVDPRHFGYFTIDWTQGTADKISYIFKGLFKSPLQLPFHWLYQYLDTWIWQFGEAQQTPLTDAQIAKAPMQLKYFMLSANKKPDGALGVSDTTPTSLGNQSINRGIFTAHKTVLALPGVQAEAERTTTTAIDSMPMHSFSDACREFRIADFFRKADELVFARVQAVQAHFAGAGKGRSATTGSPARDASPTILLGYERHPQQKSGAGQQLRASLLAADTHGVEPSRERDQPVESKYTRFPRCWVSGDDRIRPIIGLAK